MSEPAIQVKKKGEQGSQIWTMENFENKIIDMREMYQERKDKGLCMTVPYETPLRRMSSSNNSYTVRCFGGNEVDLL